MQSKQIKTTEQPPPKNIQQRLSKTNFHSHTHNRNKKLTMNRDCQEKKNKELKPRTTQRKQPKNKCKKETKRAHNHAFQEKKIQLTIRYSIKKQNQKT